MQHPSSSLEVSFLQIKINNVCDDIKRLSGPIPIAFSLFHRDLFSFYGSDSKNDDFYRCSIKSSVWGNPEGHCLCSTGLWCEDLPKNHGFVHRLAVFLSALLLTLFTQLCVLGCSYFPAAEGSSHLNSKQLLLVQASTWAAAVSEAPASPRSQPPHPVLCCRYTVTPPWRSESLSRHLFSLFACPSSGLSLFVCTSLANPQC